MGLTVRDRGVLTALGLSPIFVSADAVPLGIAALEGLATENPLSYP
jgi:hypothetical protein